MLLAHQKLNEKIKQNCDLETHLTENERSFGKQKKDLEETIDKLQQEILELKKSLLELVEAQPTSPINQQNISSMTASRDLN